MSKKKKTKATEQKLTESTRITYWDSDKMISSKEEIDKFCDSLSNKKISSTNYKEMHKTAIHHVSDELRNYFFEKLEKLEASALNEELGPKRKPTKKIDDDKYYPAVKIIYYPQGGQNKFRK